MKKTFNTRRELHEAWTPIRHLVESLTYSLEIANRADSDAKHDEEDEAGNLPAWADSNSVFGHVMKALDRVMIDYFGIPIAELDVNWGGNGSFSRDVFEALNDALVIK